MVISYDGCMVVYGYCGYFMIVWEIEFIVFFNEIVLDNEGVIDILELIVVIWYLLCYEIFCFSNFGVLGKWDFDYD